MERTLVICKPDAVARGLIGEIISRLEQKGLRIRALEQRKITMATAGVHYAEHEGKPFYPELIEFITKGPSVLVVAEGPEDTWKIVRTMMGPTNPAEAPPGTIRGDFGTVMTENLVHGSDGPDSAAREIKIFFPDLD